MSGSKTNLVFTERFRPTTLSEVRGNDHIVNRLEDWVGDPSIPHILLAGPSGTGKTSMTMAFAQDTYGDDWQQNVLEVNASDERGIDVVREKIKKFARQSAPLGSPVEYNMIFLDEADMLTKESQSALRRIMEDYSSQTKFFLSCNHKNEIIEAIQSRCYVADVSPLPSAKINERLKEIVGELDASISDEDLRKIARGSNGDMRNALSVLQAGIVGDTWNEEAAERAISSSTVDRDKLEEVVELCVKGEFRSGFELFDSEFMKRGIDHGAVCETLSKIVLDTEYEAPAKAKMLEVVADGDWRIMQGANPAVQFHRTLSMLSVARFKTYKNE